MASTIPSRNFIGLRTICRKALFGTGFLDMLLFVLHHLGDPLEVEFVKPASFANSFLPHVFGVPKWFLQIRALPKPTPVHYSGNRLSVSVEFRRLCRHAEEELRPRVLRGSQRYRQSLPPRGQLAVGPMCRPFRRVAHMPR